jgi:hypothetical protein
MKRLALGGLVLILPLAAAAGAEGPPAAELVRRLGDPSFAVREEAAASLGRLGRGAVAALEQGLKASDPEVRRRCNELLPLARRSDLDIQLDGFVAGALPKTPWPGWKRFSELAGSDVSARRFFAELYRADRPLLELLEKEPKQVAAQAAARFQKFAQQASMPRRRGEDSAPGEVEALLLTLAAAPPADAQQFYQFNNICYQAPVYSLLRGSPAARRLAGKALAPRLNDRDMLMNVANLAIYLGLTEFLDEKVRPAARTQIEAIKPDDQWRFQQAVYIANQLEMYDLLEAKLKPAIRQQAETLARNPEDQSRLFTVLNLVQTLQMDETIQTVLRPAAVAYLRSVANHPSDVGRIYSARYLAQTLGLNEVFDAVVKPAACKHAIEAAQHPEDQNKFYQAVNLAQYLNLEGAFEGALRPAGRRRILADLEKAPTDPNRLVMAAQLAQQLRLQDVAEDTLKPLARRLAKDLAGQQPDVARLTQVHSLAQALSLSELTEDAVKPALRRLQQTTGNRNPEEASFAPLMQLLRTLRMKEGVPLALRGAQAKGLNAYTRCNAIFFIGDVGTKEDVAKLEPLLKETTGVGTCGINSITIHAELRDVALATMVHASGENLADYGFPYFRIIVGIKPWDTSAGCLGFASAADREAALKKWQQHSASKNK